MDKWKIRLQLFRTVVALLFTGALAKSQTNWEEYYPLHIGDFWEYSDFGTIPTTVTRKVIADTIMSNGRSYKVIEEFVRDGPYPGKRYEYQRIDSLGNVFGYVLVSCKFPAVWVDTLIYRLAGSIGDSIAAVCILPSGHWVLAQRDRVASLGELRELTRFYLVNAVVRGVRTIAEGIGMVHYGYEGGDGNLRGAIISGKQYGNITVGVHHGEESRLAFQPKILQCYPNPFNTTTQVLYAVSDPELIEVSIYDIIGRKVRVLYRGEQPPGRYSLIWDGLNSAGAVLPTGTYLIVLHSRNSFLVRKSFYIR